jgi:hypothetical protein
MRTGISIPNTSTCVSGFASGSAEDDSRGATDVIAIVEASDADADGTAASAMNVLESAVSLRGRASTTEPAAFGLGRGQPASECRALSGTRSDIARRIESSACANEVYKKKKLH